MNRTRFFVPALPPLLSFFATVTTGPRRHPDPEASPLSSPVFRGLSLLLLSLFLTPTLHADEGPGQPAAPQPLSSRTVHAARAAAPAAAANTVELPFTVMGSHTGEATRSMSVSISNASNINRLWFKMHSGGYSATQFYQGRHQGYPKKKAEVRINGGSWVEISNKNVTCGLPESDTGCVEGPFHTVRFTLPVHASWNLKSGENTIEFKFNYVKPDPSSGYRVLGVAALRSSYGGSIGNEPAVRSASAIDGTRFIWRDPAHYASKVRVGGKQPTQADVAAGEALWYKRSRLLALPSLGQTPVKIWASCNDCHADHARDLKYFGYEPETIVARSQHHGLSQEQGEQIAAFILSQQLKDSKGRVQPPPGRPWVGVYQPGPNRVSGTSPDNVDVFFWAAGSELILDQGKDILNYINLNDFVADNKVFNLRVVPVSFQAPDWNEWLPRVHPNDGIQNFMSDYRAWNRYLEAKSGFEGGEPNDKLANRINAFRLAVQEASPKGRTSMVKGPFHVYDVSVATWQWGAVKTWELMTAHYKEDKPSYPYAEARQWYGATARTIFDIAPHINKGFAYGPDGSVYDKYLDAVWYYMQIPINSGTKNGTAFRPVDWKYHFQHINGTSSSSSSNPSLLHAISWFKVWQNGARPYPNHGNGLRNWRHLTPRWIINALSNSSMYRPLSPSDLSRVHTALVRMVNAHLYSYSTSTWKRQGSSGCPGDQDCLPPASAIPSFSYSNDKNFHNHFYTYARDMKGLVPEATLDSLARWGERMWPKGNWEQWFCSNCASKNIATAGPEEAAVLDKSLGVPDEYALLGNYPNPFNPQTQIRYDLPEQVRVTLAVYDALGRRVAMLVDQVQEAGSHEVLFDAGQLPSGIYFYQLHAGSFEQAGKMILMK